MRIGIFTDTYLPDINGVVSSVELLRKKLEEAGHDAYVICTYKSMTYKIKREGKIIRLPGIEIKQLYGYAVASPIHYFFIDELKKLDFDVIHAETEFGVGIFAGMVASELNLPLVRTYHTTYEDYTHYVNFINSKRLDERLKKLVAHWSKLYCNNCVKLISPSKKTKEMLFSYGVTTPIDIIPTGVELDRFKKDNVDLNKSLEVRKEYGIKDDEKLLVFVGRIAKEKSLDQVIRAFKQVKDNDLKVKLLVVGDGPSIDELKNLKDELGLNDCIYFAGKKPFTDVPIYYQAADGFISASTSETQGMTYIEALASGLVVLAHYDEVLEDILKEGENGFFFETIDDIYKSISKFANLDKDTVKEMSIKAEKSVKQYDSKYFQESSIRLYEEAIENYKYSYSIVKTTLKDDIVVLTLKGYDGSEEKLTLSLNFYYELGFRNASIISKFNYEALKKGEVIPLAYRRALKKLAIRDYSKKEITDYISRNFEIDNKQLEIVISKLEEKNLLDDYRFALEKTNSFKANFYSSKRMANKLRKLGIDEEIIDKVIVVDNDNELILAKRAADKYLHTIRNKSMNAKKQAIVAKLLNEGFAYEIAHEAVSNLDFSNSLLEEDSIIRKETARLIKKYEKKYKGTELRNKVYLALVSKGFNYDNIYAIINEMEL
ncbi:MAG: RecX family transcriptional regulator [Erysipelotrichaceae bacterium]|nr:RecX family transcriptional regulator [Erysipelotrichaceae bacterium]